MLDLAGKEASVLGINDINFLKDRVEGNQVLMSTKNSILIECGKIQRQRCTKCH
ncbi:hypothetical protein [Acinetobacter pollinis]|uniref:Uncharacterized protein n=1 Tax=Acinetobacter pollinis TaxID=2605270 RepID=A0ABU6DWF7_9GAMM|nr:hypothetical protein [Acinetobacter pollinis]MEB5477514.1 hypothetical protein [Acinetobacter pollinis]